MINNVLDHTSLSVFNSLSFIYSYLISPLDLLYRKYRKVQNKYEKVETFAKTLMLNIIT